MAIFIFLNMTNRRGPESRPGIGRGKRFAVVAGFAFTAACSAEIQSTPTTEIFPTQPQTIVPTSSSVDRIGDKMAELTQLPATPEPTATPNYQELQALKPAGVEGEVVMGENGRPQLRVEIQNFDVPEEGLVIAERINGEWVPNPFEVSVASEQTLDDFRVIPSYIYDQKFYENPDNGLGSVGFNFTRIQSVRLDYEESSGEFKLGFGFLHSGRIFKTNVDVIHIHPASNVYKNDFFEPKKLTVESIYRLIRLVDLHRVLANNIRSEADFTYFTDGFDFQRCEQIGNRHNSLVDYCKQVARDPENRRLKTENDAQELISQYFRRVSESTIKEGINWWGNDLLEPTPEDISVAMYFGVPEEIPYDWP